MAQLLGVPLRAGSTDAEVCDVLKAGCVATRDNALALWAVRVLDAWALASATKKYRAWWECDPDQNECDLVYPGGRKSFDGPTPDAARLAAAEALAPELGDKCPVRP